MHAETNSEIRDAILAGITHSIDLALDTPVAEAAGNNNAIYIANTIQALLLDIRRLDEMNLDASARVDATVLQRLEFQPGDELLVTDHTPDVPIRSSDTLLLRLLRARAGREPLAPTVDVLLERALKSRERVVEAFPV